VYMWGCSGLNAHFNTTPKTAELFARVSCRPYTIYEDMSCLATDKREMTSVVTNTVSLVLKYFAKYSTKLSI